MNKFKNVLNNIRLYFSVFNSENRAALWVHFIRNLPSEGIFPEFRWRFYKKRLKNCGRFYTHTGVIIKGWNLISIGQGSWINTGCMLFATGKAQISLGENVMLGPYCVITSQQHSVLDTNQPMIKQPLSGEGAVIIEDDCWLGAHVVIAGNVKIGKGSVIGANSFVNKDIPAYSIAVGSPARVIKSRLETDRSSGSQ
ncbi:MAG: acyltransferase [Candidatus Omnitrophica bacterium]|nr:acyltransferase [Candidatus Omnitrophota bacterium]